eukprot:11109444-Alexandrium_andersonii.AAC.1
MNLPRWSEISSDSSGEYPAAEEDPVAMPNRVRFGEVETLARPNRVHFGNAEIQRFDVASARDWRPVASRGASTAVAGARAADGATGRGSSDPVEHIRFGS